MAKINEIDIKIEKAVITRIQIELSSEEPSWYVTASLLTKHGKQVAEVNAHNRSWGSDEPLQIPLAANALAAELFKTLNQAFVEYINGKTKSLTAPEK